MYIYHFSNIIKSNRGDSMNIDKLKYEAEELGNISSASKLSEYYYDCDNSINAIYYFDICLNSKTKGFDEMIILGIAKYLYINYFYSGSYEIAKSISGKIREYKFKNISNIEDILNEVFIYDDEIVKRLNEKIVVPKKVINRLKKYYDEYTISLMEPEIIIYIYTSIKMYDYINRSKEILDYSASLISILKAVEKILYTIFVDNYFASLETDLWNIKYNINHFGNKFIKTDKDKKVRYLKTNVDSIELGPIMHCIGSRDNNTQKLELYDEFKKFYIYYSNVSDEEATNIITELYERLESIHNRRNKVCHKARIIKEDADSLIKDLIYDQIDFISFLYDKFLFCFKYW